MKNTKLFFLQNFFLTILFAVPYITFAQNNAYSFGKGVVFMAEDSTFNLKIGARIQSLFVLENSLDNNPDDLTTSFMTRRMRVKMDGFVLNPKVVYKIELALSNRDLGKPIAQTGNAVNPVLDAVVKWNFYKNFEVWFGQTKLPGNRERVVSSQQMQFVDRSIVNSEFNIDRDLGVQLHHHFTLGKNFLVREIFSISNGEGRNITVDNIGGYCYTGRVEFLPFGEFSSKGDYVGGAIKREAKPKLSLAFGYDFNDDASRAQGQLGSFLPGMTDLKTIMADAMFKYQGVSFMVEYMDKTASNPVIKDTSNNVLGEFIVGKGLNAQLGYNFKNNIELAGRYSMIDFDSQISEGDLQQYTFCISKYFNEHNLKIQSDVSLTDIEGVNDKMFMFRFQVELAF